MEKKMKHIDNLFKDELGSYTETPPPPAWGSLEKRLNERRRRKFPYGWFWYVSVISFMALLGASVLWKMTNGTSPAISNTAISASAANAPHSKSIAQAASKNTDIKIRSGKNAIASVKIDHSKQSTEKNDNQALPTTATKKAFVNHKSKNHKNIATKKKNNEQIISAKTIKTNEELYADEDDDQYTVGYSSTARKNNIPSAENENDETGYVVQERNHDHIYVAEMEPKQQVSEATYGSRLSQVDENKAFQARNARIASQTAQVSTINIQHDQSTSHNHKNTLTHISSTNSIAAKKSSDIHSLKTVVVKERTRQTDNNRLSTSNVLAASLSLLKTKKTKQTAGIAYNSNENQVRKNGRKRIGKKNAVNDRSTTEAVANNNTAATKAIVATGTKDNNPSGTSSSPWVSETIANTPAGKQATEAITTNKNIDAATKHEKDAQIPAKLKSKATAIATTLRSGTATNPASKKMNDVENNNKPLDIQASSKNNIYASGSDKQIPKVKLPVKSGASASAVAHKKQPVKRIATASGIGHDPISVTNNKSSIAGNTPADKAAAKVKADKPAHTFVAATTNVAKDKVKPVMHVVSKATVETGVARNEKEHAVKTKADKKTQTGNNNVVVDKKSVAKKDRKTTKKATGKKVAGNISAPAQQGQVVPPAPGRIFSSSFSGRTLADEAAMIDNLQVNSFNSQQPISDNSTTALPGTFKQDAKPATDSLAKTETQDSTVKHKSCSKRFEIGIKSGYETGFNKNAANKFVVAPFLQYNLSDKFSLLTQPSVKASYINSAVGTPHTYYDTVKGTGPTPLGNSVAVVIITGGSSYTTVGTIQEYTYEQQYKSIVKSYDYGGNYYEFEIPLLLKYKILPRLSVYGGANMIYGKYISIKENTATSGILTKFDTAHVFTPLGQPANQPQGINKAIPLPGLPYTSYNGSVYPSPPGDLLRLGYMLGFSYEYKKRWLFDVLVQQAMVKPDNETGVNTNAPLELPYFRFTIGYKLTK